MAKSKQKTAKDMLQDIFDKFQKQKNPGLYSFTTDENHAILRIKHEDAEICYIRVKVEDTDEPREVRYVLEKFGKALNKIGENLDNILKPQKKEEEKEVNAAIKTLSGNMKKLENYLLAEGDKL